MAYFNFLVADMTYALTYGVSWTLKHNNNATNIFPVPESLDLEPLFVFI